MSTCTRVIHFVLYPFAFILEKLDLYDCAFFHVVAIAVDLIQIVT